MRYIIDTEGEKAQDWGNTLRRAAERGELTIIEETDSIEVMKENLRTIARAMEVLNKNGISKELMESYISVHREWESVKRELIEMVYMTKKDSLKN